MDALNEAEDLYGEKGVRIQALYISSNLIAENDEQDRILDQLQALGYDKPYKGAEKSDEYDMTEIQLERLVDAFTEYSLDRRDADGKVDMAIFEGFAKERGISLEKALVANDWVDDVLTPEASIAVKNAWEKVKVKGINV
jgi:hypothetical protein